MPQNQPSDDQWQHDFHSALAELNNGKLFQGSEFQSGL